MYCGNAAIVARGRRWVRRARRAHGGDRERGQQEGDGVVTLYVVVIHMSAPKGSLSKGARSAPRRARSAPRPFSRRRAAPSGILRRAQAIVIRL